MSRQASQGGAMNGAPARGQFVANKMVGQPSTISMGGNLAGLAGGYGADYQCAFPAPPPFRVYCQPAAFSSTDGRNFQLLVNAYGASRPMANLM